MNDENKIIAKSKILLNYTVTIPKAVRTKFNFNPGEHVFWIVDGNDLKLKKGRIRIIFESEE